MLAIFIVAYAQLKLWKLVINLHSGIAFHVDECPRQHGEKEKGKRGEKGSQKSWCLRSRCSQYNGESMQPFETNHDLALVNTFLGTTKRGVSNTLNGRGEKRIDYILTSQRGPKHVRNVTVYPQPSCFPIPDHTILSAPVKLIDYFSCNRRLMILLSHQSAAGA